ncbi:MAG: response regulator [Anaerobacillus sp.]
MFNIMIVDDEQVERDAVELMISREYGEKVKIQKAKNGREAIELVDEFQPQLVFMDIKMPGIDGVQAVKTIKKTHPDIRFIMLSAFDTFDYAREVMQQGVKEYLLKPSRKQEIFSAITRITTELENERAETTRKEHVQAQLAKAVHLLEGEWMNAILMNQVTEFSPAEWSELLGFQTTVGYAVVFKLPTKDEAFMNTMVQWLKEEMKATFPDEAMIGVRDDCYLPGFLFSENLHEKDKRLKAQLQPTLRNLIHEFKIRFHNGVCIGVGRPYQEADQFVASYREALYTVHALDFDRDVTYAFYQESKSANVPRQDRTQDQESLVISAINNGDFTRATQELEVYLELISGASSSVFVQKLNELFLVAARILQNNGIVLTTYTYIKAESEYEAANLAREKLRKLNENVHTWRSLHGGDRLEQVKKYIRAHFHEQLTLEEAAEYVALSPYYVSKLFKEKSGMTFIDYVTEVRIEAAKREMLDPSKSLKEICFTVGYKDPNYFSRVFKRKAGLSPSQYRDQLCV